MNYLHRTTQHDWLGSHPYPRETVYRAFVWDPQVGEGMPLLDQYFRTYDAASGWVKGARAEYKNPTAYWIRRYESHLVAEEIL